MLIKLVFLWAEDMCSVDLQMKYVILTSVKNIRNCESFVLIKRELVIFVTSLCFMSIWRRKLRMWLYSSASIPALRWFI
jgi:hypothetical protein